MGAVRVCIVAKYNQNQNLKPRMSSNNPYTTNHSQYVALFLLLFLGIYHTCGYYGHFGYDDMYYAQYAAQVAKGTLSLPSDHYAYRWALIFPVGLCYSLFGINDSASSIFPLIVTAITLFLVHRASLRLAAPQWRNETSIVAMSLFLLSHWTLFYADKIMPDTLVTLGIVGSLYAVARQRYNKTSPQKTLFNVLVGTFSLWFAFLSKENVLLLLPLFAFLLIADWVQGKQRRFWTSIILLNLVIAFSYFGFFYIQKGNPFYRFEAIKLNSYFNPSCSYDVLPYAVVLRRISYELPLIFIGGGMALGMAASLLSLSQHSIKQWWRSEDEPTFWISSFVGAFLLSNFMTTSTHAYMPLCADPRHYLYLVPIASLAAAPYLVELIKGKQSSLSFALLLACFTALCIWHGHGIGILCYLPLSLYFFYLFFIFAYKNKKKPIENDRLWAVISFKKNKYTHHFALYLFLFFLMPYHLHYMRHARKTNYHAQKELIHDFFKKQTTPTLVITSDVQAKLATYYHAFDTIANQFITYKEAQKYPFANENRKIYVLSTQFGNQHSGFSPKTLPYYIQNPPPNMQKMYHNPDNTLLIYEVNQAATMQWE